jgi:type VI secretion system secreted protein VgrG
VLHLNDALASQAHTDASAAYAALTGLSSNVIVLTGQDLGGKTLTPGVYSFSSSAFLTGTLTLDGLGQADPQWVFQIGSTLVTSSGSAVLGINGAGGDNVFFQVGSAATFGTNSQFEGTVIASQSITMNTGAALTGGRLLALDGAVTLDDNSIAIIPESQSCVFLLLGLTSVAGQRSRRKS